jgi:SWI/SNF-related matrix-associated actin-dependent regulator of chromatin subfamily A-like protein 1
VRTCMVRRLKKDVMPELPERIRTILPVDISNRAEYKHASRDFLGWLKTVMDEGTVRRAARAEWLVRGGYLKRLACEGKIKTIFELVNSFLEETNEKLLLFGLHKFMVKALREKFPHNSVVIDGSVVGKKRQIAVDIFQSKPNIRLMIGNMKAAGEGVNLTAANNVDILELPFVPATVSQCLARAHRIGQQRTCFERFIIAKGTIEEKLCEVLQKRQDAFNEAFDGGKGEMLSIRDELSQALLNGHS